MERNDRYLLFFECFIIIKFTKIMNNKTNFEHFYYINKKNLSKKPLFYWFEVLKFIVHS